MLASQYGLYIFPYSRLLWCYRYMPDLGAESVNCWAGRDDEGGGNTGDDMLVMASAAKSGAVLSARLVVEVRSPHAR
jgi:hypothetical protein